MEFWFRSKDDDLPELLKPLLAGHDAGLISEAGVPAIADPGANLVRLAHQHGILVQIGRRRFARTFKTPSGRSRCWIDFRGRSTRHRRPRSQSGSSGTSAWNSGSDRKTTICPNF